MTDTTPTAEQAAQRITEALEKGPTPGEWHDCGGFSPSYGGLTSEEGYIVFGYADSNVHQEHGEPIKSPSMDRQFANRKYIAAASPAALRVLMAERAEWSDRTAEAQAERDAAREERDELLKDVARLRAKL